MKPKEPVGVWKRLLGFLYGGIGGFALGVFLSVILDVCEVAIGGYQVVGCCAGCCAVLGFVFPRTLIATSYILINGL